MGGAQGEGCLHKVDQVDGTGLVGGLARCQKGLAHSVKQGLVRVGNQLRDLESSAHKDLVHKSSTRGGTTLVNGKL